MMNMMMMMMMMMVITLLSAASALSTASPSAAGPFGKNDIDNTWYSINFPRTLFSPHLSFASSQESFVEWFARWLYQSLEGFPIHDSRESAK